MELPSTSPQSALFTPMEESEEHLDDNFFTVAEDWSQDTCLRTSPRLVTPFEGVSNGTASLLPSLPYSAAGSPDRLSPQVAQCESRYGESSQSEHTESPSSDEDENGHSAGDRYERALASISAERLRYLTLPAPRTRSSLPTDYFSPPHLSVSKAFGAPSPRSYSYPDPSPSSFYSFGQSEVPETIEEESEPGSDRRRSSSSMAQSLTPLGFLRKLSSSPSLRDGDIAFRSPDGARSVKVEAEAREHGGSKDTDPTLALATKRDLTQTGERSPLIEQSNLNVSSVPIASPKGSSSSKSPPSDLQTRRSSSSVGPPGSIVSSGSAESPQSSHRRKFWKDFLFPSLEAKLSVSFGDQQCSPRPPLRASSLASQTGTDLTGTGVVPHTRSLRHRQIHTPTDMSAGSSPTTHRSSWRKRLSSLSRRPDISRPGGDLGAFTPTPPIRQRDAPSEASGQILGRLSHQTPAAETVGGSGYPTVSSSRAPTSVQRRDEKTLVPTWPRVIADTQSDSSHRKNIGHASSSGLHSLRRMPHFSQLSMAGSIKHDTHTDRQSAAEHSAQRSSLTVGEAKLHSAQASTTEVSPMRRGSVTRQRSSSFGGSDTPLPLISYSMDVSQDLPNRSLGCEESYNALQHPDLPCPSKTFLGFPSLRMGARTLFSSSMDQRGSLSRCRPASVLLSSFDLRLPEASQLSRRRSLPSAWRGASLNAEGLVAPSPRMCPDPSALVNWRDSDRRRSGSGRKSVERGVGMGLLMHLSLAAWFGWNDGATEKAGEAQPDREVGEEDSYASAATGDDQDESQVMQSEKAAARQRAMDVLTGRRPSGAVPEEPVPALQSTTARSGDCGREVASTSVIGSVERRRGRRRMSLASPYRTWECDALHSISQAMLASDVPEYISARSANSIISELRPTRIQAEALSHLNRILDEVLLFVVASSKSLATDRIKTDGVLKVFNNNPLAKDAVLEAEMELRKYLQGKKAEGGRVPLGLSATSRWDGTEAFPVASAYEGLRIRCQYYSTLGDREDHNITNGDQHIMSSEGRPIATITPGVSVYVTALLEYIAEHILKKVARVVERDNSDEASLADLKAAVEEDESMLTVWRQMVVKKEIGGRLAEVASSGAGSGRTSRPWKVPGEDEFDKAASGSTFRSSRQPRPSTAQSTLLAAMERSSSSASGHSHSIGHGHGNMREESHYIGRDYGSEAHDVSSGANTPSAASIGASPMSPSFSRSSNHDRPSSPAHRTRLSRKSSFDKGLISIFGSKRRGSVKLDQEGPSAVATGVKVPALERDSPQSTNFPDDFEAVMMSGQTTRVSLTPNRLHTIETQKDEEEGDARNKNKKIDSQAKKFRQRPGILTVAELRNEISAENSSRTSSPGSAAPLRDAFEDSPDRSGKPLPGFPPAARRSESSRNSNPPSSYRGPDNPSIAALPPHQSVYREDGVGIVRVGSGMTSPQGYDSTASRGALATVEPSVMATRLVSPEEAPVMAPSGGSFGEHNGDRSPTSHAPPRTPRMDDTAAVHDPDRLAPSRNGVIYSQAKVGNTTLSSPESIPGSRSSGSLPVSSHRDHPSTPGTLPRTYTQVQVGTSLRPQAARDGRLVPAESLKSKAHLYAAASSIEPTSAGGATENGFPTTSLRSTSEGRQSNNTTETERELRKVIPAVSGPSSDDSTARPFTAAAASSTSPRSRSDTYTQRSSCLEEARPEGPPSRKIPYGRRASRDGAAVSSYRRQSSDSAFKPLNGGGGIDSDSDANADPTVKLGAPDTRLYAGPDRHHQTWSLPPTPGKSTAMSPVIRALADLSQRMKACSTVAECQSLVAEVLVATLAGAVDSVGSVRAKTDEGTTEPRSSVSDLELRPVVSNESEGRGSESEAASLSDTLHGPFLEVVRPAPQSTSATLGATPYSEEEDVNSSTYKETQYVAAWLLGDAESILASPTYVHFNQKRRPLSLSASASFASLQLRPLLTANASPSASLVIDPQGTGKARPLSTGTIGEGTYLTADEEDVEDTRSGGKAQRAQDGSIGRWSGGSTSVFLTQDQLHQPQQPTNAVMAAEAGVLAGVMPKTARPSMRSSALNGNGSGSAGRPPPSASGAAIRLLRASSGID